MKKKDPKVQRSGSENKMPYVMVDKSIFPFELGIKLLRKKYKTLANLKKEGYLRKSREKEVEAEWNKGEEVSVLEALSLDNLESRRVCFSYIGIEEIFKQLNPTLVDVKTVNKSTRVTKDGTLESFEDTYELYKVSGETLASGSDGRPVSARNVSDFFILSCQCTSTGRKYLIYINDIWKGASAKPDAIEAVAWTIQVDAKSEDIEKIIRAGDCIMVKLKPGASTSNSPRHLTKNEYLEKVVMES